jgi:hypothetical protein
LPMLRIPTITVETSGGDSTKRSACSGTSQLPR